MPQDKYIIIIPVLKKGENPVKFLALLTALAAIITAILGVASYLGSEMTGRYHLIAGFLTLFLVLFLTHQLFYGQNSRK